MVFRPTSSKYQNLLNDCHLELIGRNQLKKTPCILVTVKKILMGVKEDIPKNAAVLLDFVQINTKIQPKKQFKVQIIGIFEEIDSFY